MFLLWPVDLNYEEYFNLYLMTSSCFDTRHFTKYNGRCVCLCLCAHVCMWVCVAVALFTRVYGCVPVSVPVCLLEGVFQDFLNRTGKVASTMELEL